MMGRNHVFTEVAIGVTTIEVLEHIDLRLGIHCSNILIPDTLNFSFLNGILNNAVVYFLVAGCLFWIGCLLPDIDSKSSLFGRFVKFPGEHRTWTHSIWACIIMFVLCFAHPVVRFLSFAYVLHIWLDSVSAGGVCFLYPATHFIRYESGAFVAPNHKIKIYRAGKISEAVFVAIIIALCFVICILFIYQYFS